MDKELNLVLCKTRNMFDLVGDIPPQWGQPTFLSTTRNKAYTKILSLLCWLISQSGDLIISNPLEQVRRNPIDKSGSIAWTLTETYIFRSL